MYPGTVPYSEGSQGMHPISVGFPSNLNSPWLSALQTRCTHFPEALQGSLPWPLFSTLCLQSLTHLSLSSLCHSHLLVLPLASHTPWAPSHLLPVSCGSSGCRDPSPPRTISSDFASLCLSFPIFWMGAGEPKGCPILRGAASRPDRGCPGLASSGVD